MMKWVKMAAVVTFGAGLLAAVSVYAQQVGNPSSPDFKPAQAASPAAHPTGNANTGNQNEQRRQPSDQPGVQVTAGYAPNDDRGENQDQNLDRALAACLLTANKGEVELGKMAQQRATDKDVKAFSLAVLHCPMDVQG